MRSKRCAMMLMRRSNTSGVSVKKEQRHKAAATQASQSKQSEVFGQ
jgi:hypothetical protein